jgi:hypothetical protein
MYATSPADHPSLFACPRPPSPRLMHATDTPAITTTRSTTTATKTTSTTRSTTTTTATTNTHWVCVSYLEQLLNYAVGLCVLHGWTHLQTQFSAVVDRHKQAFHGAQLEEVAQAELCSTKCVAFAMARHARLGEGSQVSSVEEDVARMIMAAAGLTTCSSYSEWGGPQ